MYCEGKGGKEGESQSTTYNFCFIKFSPSCTVEAVDALQTLFRGPLTPGLGSGPGLGGQHLAMLTIGKTRYKFCVINFALK